MELDFCLGSAEQLRDLDCDHLRLELPGLLCEKLHIVALCAAAKQGQGTSNPVIIIIIIISMCASLSLSLSLSYRRERDDLELVAVLRHYVERLGSDGPRRPDERDGLGPGL